MSSKNRKKLLRRIVVNNEIYYWSVTDRNCDGDGGERFQIWKDRKLIHFRMVWNKTITPKIVREQILKIDSSVPFKMPKYYLGETEPYFD